SSWRWCSSTRPACLTDGLRHRPASILADGHVAPRRTDVFAVDLPPLRRRPGRGHGRSGQGGVRVPGGPDRRRRRARGPVRAERGATTTSSEGLAEAAGVNSAKVRKDLSYLGSYGTRGVGYDVAYLIHQIRRELGLTQHWPVLIVGAGNLGHALVNYRGFVERGFRIAALLDSARPKVGERVDGIAVEHIDALAELVRREDVAIRVICTP